MKFNEIIENEQLLKAIEKMGFEQPSPIQEKVIPLIKENKDVIGHAKTGTGKTAAFGLPILEKIDLNKKSIQVLVLVPTRELAKQVMEEIERLGSFMKGLKTCVVYGGQSYTIQKQQLNRKPHILVATPGRLIDLLDRKYVSLETIDYLVLDEADEMLSIGFAQDLEKIVDFVSEDRHTLLFSATFNDNVLKLSNQYLTNPTRVSVVSKDKVAQTITQKYMLAQKNEQFKVLQKLLLLHNEDMIMVFANTKREVDAIVEDLQQGGVMAEAIHGDLSQKMRENVLAKFKKGVTKVLVCSDVAARGLDIKGVDVIVNIDLPFEKEYYVHRVGRTGRANQEGIAYTILSKNRERKLKQLEKELKTTITKMPVISNKDIQQIKNKVILDQIEDSILNNETDNIDKINPLLKKGYDLDSIFHGLLNMLYKEEALEEGNEVRVFINLGKRDRVGRKEMAQIFSLPKEILYDIEIRDNFSFATLNSKDYEQIIKKVSKQKYNKRKVNVEVANS